MALIQLGADQVKFSSLTWEGIWALVELGPLLCIPIPFSVKNSSRSMYWSWNKPPSHGRVLSHRSGPRKADWESGRTALDPRAPVTPPGPPPLAPTESSSESKGLSLSERRRDNESVRLFHFQPVSDHRRLNFFLLPLVWKTRADLHSDNPADRQKRLIISFSLLSFVYRY